MSDILVTVTVIAVTFVAFPFIYIGSVWFVCTGVIEINGGEEWARNMTPPHDERIDTREHGMKH